MTSTARRLQRAATEFLTSPYLVAAVTSSIGAAWALRLWRADLHVPFVYYGDAVAVSAHVKTTLARGWYESQPLLGWPYGQHFHDFPMSDDLHLFVLRVLGLVLRDWALTLNVYFFLGFPLAALTSAYVMRRLGVGRAMTVLVATLYALAPYHFTRSESHFFLASYWVVPPAVLVVVRSLRGEPVWAAPNDRAWRLGPVRVTRRGALTALAMVLVSGGAAYYGVFVLCLLAVAGIVGAIHTRSWRHLVGSAAAGVVAVGTMVAFMLPDILWAHAHGTDTAALNRDASGAEVYALKVTSLLLPVPGHAFAPFAMLRQLYDSAYPLPSEQPALGLTAALGLVALLVIAVIELGRPRSVARPPAGRWPTLVAIATLALVALLFSTVGGVGSLISFLTPNIRGWNRMSIIIALLALAAVGLGLDHLAGALRARTSARVASAAVVVVACVGMVAGTLDQVSPSARPDVVAVAKQFTMDAAWVTQVESTLGADAAIFQLPYMSFPESAALNGVYDTDQLKPFLHSDTLRWSGGGIKGRAASDWPATVAALPPDLAADALAAAGFSGVVLDTAALGDQAGSVREAWQAVAGVPVVIGSDGRYLVFDLRPVAAKIADAHSSEVLKGVAEAATEPVMLYPAEATHAGGTAEAVQWSGSSGVEVIVDNPENGPRPVTLTLTVIGGPNPVEASAPWGTRALSPGQTAQWSVTVPPGRSLLTIGSGQPVTISAPTATASPSVEQLLGGP